VPAVAADVPLGGAHSDSARRCLADDVFVDRAVAIVVDSVTGQVDIGERCSGRAVLDFVTLLADEEACRKAHAPSTGHRTRNVVVVDDAVAIVVGLVAIGIGVAVGRKRRADLDLPITAGRDDDFAHAQSTRRRAAVRDRRVLAFLKRSAGIVGTRIRVVAVGVGGAQRCREREAGCATGERPRDDQRRTEHENDAPSRDLNAGHVGYPFRVLRRKNVRSTSQRCAPRSMAFVAFWAGAFRRR
jgi:hypothetical protein